MYDAQSVLLLIEDILCKKRPCSAKTMKERHRRCIGIIEQYAKEQVEHTRGEIRLLGCYEPPEEYD